MEGSTPDRPEHTLLRARDWQHRPQLDMVCESWRTYGAGLCALVGIGGAGKTAIADRSFHDIARGVLPDCEAVRQGLASDGLQRGMLTDDPSLA